MTQRFALIGVCAVLVVTLSSLAEAQKGKGPKPCKGKGQFGCVDPIPPPVVPPSPPTLPAGWILQWSDGVTLGQTPEGYPTFVFPAAPGHVNYFHKAWAGASHGTITATIAIAVETGAPAFQVAFPFPGCEYDPAAMRFYVEGSNAFAGTGTPGYDYKRWWYAGSLRLAQGTFSISAAIDPALWTSVQGKSGTYDAEAFDWFWRTFNGTGSRIGFTFGGGCHFGHGVYTTGGTARLTVTAYAVQ